jgi:FMN phosphatase YigB (HAD superfamily)
VAVTFDLFGTLVDVERPSAPGAAVAAELRARDVPVPDDWHDAYREAHVEFERGQECSLVAHARATLASRDVDAADTVVADAVRTAFDPDEVRTREGATEAVVAAAERGPVAVLSNCSVPGLVERALARSAVDADRFDAVLASVDAGWRKPFDGAFEHAADRLVVAVGDLVHVGDDPRADGGIRTLGGTFVDVAEVPLADFPSYLEAEE